MTCLGTKIFDGFFQGFFFPVELCLHSFQLVGKFGVLFFQFCQLVIVNLVLFVVSVDTVECFGVVNRRRR